MTVAHMNLIGPGFPNTGWQKAFAENGFEKYIGIDWVKIKNGHGYDKMWASIIHNIKRSKVDLLFMQLQSPGALTPDNIKELREVVKGKIVLYNIDARYPEEVQWIYDAAPHLDFCALSNQRDVYYINERHPGKAGLVQSSCDMNYYHRTRYDIFNNEYEVVFLANNYQNTSRRFPMCDYRQELIEFLHNRFYREFKCFGRRQKENSVMPFREREIYNRSKIAISCNNFELEGYTSDRIWRAMASGCFVLAKYFPGIEDMFVICEHLDVWRSKEELEWKIRHYLDRPLYRNIISQNGMNHVRENHTLTNRVKQIIDAI